MIQLSNIKMPLDFGIDNDGRALEDAVARELKIDRKSIKSILMLRRAVDARKKSDVHFVITAIVELDSAKHEKHAIDHCKNAKPCDGEPESPIPTHVANTGDEGEGGKANSNDGAMHAAVASLRAEARPVVVGSGPAGLFAALMLARSGARPIVLERGSKVDERLNAINTFRRTGVLDKRSNVQFGEGGAGTFSDGKLTTGLSDPYIRGVLHAFVDHGAPEEILWQARPHIGTDLLPGIIKRIREDIEKCGGTFEFDTRLDNIEIQNSKLIAIVAEKPDGTRAEIPCNSMILATGHSAKDTYEMLLSHGFEMERKPFSMGVRIEHLQRAINMAQYGKICDHPALGPADYKLSCHLESGRSVYTFCMCPGGEVVPAASEEGHLVVNGMSRYARDGENANSAVLVNVTPDDFERYMPSEQGGSEFSGSAYGSRADDALLHGPLAGLEMQRSWEARAFELGGSAYKAPAQLYGDLRKNRASNNARSVQPSYPIGVTYTNLADTLPPFVIESLREAIPIFGRKIHGFDDPSAVLTGIESRSSAPVRVLRDKGTWQSNIEGVYPCGEGAGYAGGIMSSAVDGIHCAEKLMENSDLMD